MSDKSQHPAQASAPVDVIIVTFNEEINLPHTLRSICGWAHQVFVVDSGSTDRTREIAQEHGATVISHDWEGYARQKNWALDNLPLQSPWVLIVDADEAVSDELRAEVTRICSQDPARIPQAGFYINRALIFMGKRIRHCGYNPSWNLRLFKRGMARYEDRPVHEHMILAGKEGYLRPLLLHEDRRGLEYYIAKHNRYSTLEAETLLQDHPAEVHPSLQPRLFGNAVQRRRWYREKIYPRLPAKWLWRFLWMYFFRAGILDGANGLRFCLLISTHELFTSLKLRELRGRTGDAIHQPPEPAAPPTTAHQLVVTPRVIELPKAAETPLRPADVASPASAGRAGSSWSTMENIKRVLWMFTQATFFGWSFHNWYAWRRFLLRCFGARIGRGVCVRPTVRIEIPWHLSIGDDAVVGDYAILYCLGQVTIGRHSVISQYAHLCAGTHDYTTRRFPLIRRPITIGDDVWIAADSFIGPDVTVGHRSVIGARSTVLKNVPADELWAGSPAKYIKKRELIS